MSFPKYPEYKDSGVEWLGDVPAHWRIEPLKWHCDVMPSNVDKKSAEGEQPVLLCNYTDVYYNDQITVALDFMKATASNSQIDRFTLRQGDVVFTKDSESPEDIAVSAFVPLDLPGIVCGYHLAIARSHRTLIGKFLKWYFDSQSAKAYFYVSANGLTRVGLSQYASDNLPLPLPSLREQENISAFLDHETARIDALVAEQQRLIELLKEKRQAVISHAVTKGLNPDVPMKDSGVEWLGEVPAHWGVGKIKWHISTASGGTPPSNEQEKYYGGEVPWLRSLDLTDDLVTTFEVSITATALVETAARIVPKGSVLIAMYGGDGTIGKNGLLSFDAAINQALCAFLPNSLFLPKYLHRYLQFYRPYWMVGAESSRKDPNIGQDRIGDSYCIVPPIDEQSAIAIQLEHQLDDIARSTCGAENLISLLTERRSALISAAVTGKIDVRGWQPPPGSPSPTEIAAREPA